AARLRVSAASSTPGSRGTATRASEPSSGRCIRRRSPGVLPARSSPRADSSTHVSAAQGYLLRPRIVFRPHLPGVEHVMATTTAKEWGGPVGLADHGLSPAGDVHWNPTTALLYTHALKRDEGRLAEGGPLVVDTGRFTGRSPKDKFVVREPGSEDRIWWGSVNHEISEEHFEGLREKVVAHLDEQELYVVDAFAGSDPAHCIAVRVVTGRPYHALFAKTMFIEPTDEELRAFRPQALVLHAPEVEAEPEADGTRTETFVVLHPTRAEILV